MVTTANDNNQTPDSAWSMYRALVGVGVVCALLIVSAFLLTLPAIEKNKSEALERAIFKVLPGASTKKTFVLTENKSFKALSVDKKAQAAPRTETIYAGYDAEHRLVGLAIKAQGMGYQDTLKVIYGYAPDRQVIVGMQVLESKETPGLGDKIEKDKNFVANFSQLDVRLTPDSTAIKNPVVAVKPGQKTRPWQIDGITGATISSRAIAEILRVSTMRMVPLAQDNLETFSLNGGDDNES